MPTRIITIANHKGGTGKTTTAVTLGHGLAAKGKNVLLVDLDPQGQMAVSLGLKQEEGAYYLATMGTKPHETAFIKQFVRNTGRESLWLIASDQTLGAAQDVISARGYPISWIRTTLERFTKNGLDYVVLDTSPSVGGIQERALWACDLALIPSSTEYLVTDGTKKIVDLMALLQSEKEWRGALIGVLPTMFDQRIGEHRQALADLERGLPGRVLPVIHAAALLKECPANAKTIFEYAPDSRAATEYQALVEYVLRC